MPLYVGGPVFEQREFVTNHVNKFFSQKYTLI